jgi:hypothetical protein
VKQRLLRWIMTCLLGASPAFAADFPTSLYTYTEPGTLITKPMFSALAEEVEAIEATLGINLTGIDNHAFGDPSVQGMLSLGTGISTGTPAEAPLKWPILTAAPPTVNGHMWLEDDGVLRYTVGGVTYELAEADGITAIEEDGSNLTPFSSTLNFTGLGITCAPSGGKIVCNVPGLGAVAFTDLTDVDNDYTGDATKLVAVNLAATGLEFRTLLDTDIPSLAASKITSGTFDAARIPALAASTITFADAPANFTATDVEAAIAELAAVNGSGVNAADGKVEWTQLVGVPAGFADGTDDGGGGGSAISFDATNDGTPESTSITHLECDGNGLACSEPVADEARIALSIGTGATQVAAGDHAHAATAITFSDPDSNWTAANVDAALAELDDVINGGVPNAATGKVDWSQLVNVPAGFADGSDDGAGGSGDEVSVNSTALGNMNLLDGTDITWSLNATPDPDEVTPVLAAGITRDTEWDTVAEINAATGETILTDASTLDDDLVAFDDTDGLWTATLIGPALEELNDSINAGAPNGTGAKVHWSQLLGVPAGFADGTDDGGGGGSPGGDTNDVQYNTGSGFGGESAFEWDAGLDILTLASGKFRISSGASSASDSTRIPIYVDATLNSSPSITQFGTRFLVTSAGSTSQVQIASQILLDAGYTGSSATGALSTTNLAAGTGANLSLGTQSSNSLNSSVSGNASATTTGYNAGISAQASGSSGLNAGVFAETATAQAGSNIAGLFSAANSTEATDLKNIGVLGTLGTALPTENRSAAGYFDGGTLADANSHVLRLIGTLPSSPAAIPSGVKIDITSAGSSATQIPVAMLAALGAGYTGSQTTVTISANNSAAGTAASLGLGGSTTGNVSYGGGASASGAGYNIGIAVGGSNSTGLNAGGVLKAVSAVAGTNIGVLGNAANSTEATDLKNVGVLGTLATSLPTENRSAAGYFDGGTLADANAHVIRGRATLPGSPSAAAEAYLFDAISAGSAAQTPATLRVNLFAGYTGSSPTRAALIYNNAAGTGGDLLLGTTSATGNIGSFGLSDPAGAGFNFGAIGEARSSTGVNVGSYGKASTVVAGSNIGVLGAADDSTEATGLKDVGVLGTTDTALPAANVSAGVLAAAAAGGFPFRAYYDDTEVFRIDDSATAGDTYLMLWDVDNGTLERVTVGAADSCGAGFKCLRIPN